MSDTAAHQDLPTNPARPGAFEKLKGYLGLLVALAIAVLAFLPVGRSGLYPRAPTLTALDNTVLTQLLILKSDDLRYRMYASQSLRVCPPAQALLPEARRALYMGWNCEGVDLMLVQLTREKVTDIKPFEPNLQALLDEYEPRLRTDVAEDDPRKRVKNSATREAELEQPIFTAVAKYLDSQHAALASAVYISHGAWLLLAFVVVLLRRQVGAALLWPLSVVVSAGTVGAKAAKQLHEKV